MKCAPMMERNTTGFHFHNYRLFISHVTQEG